MGALTDCEKYLKECFEIVKILIGKECSVKYLKYLSKLHMQYCAIMSQQNKHLKALDHAKYAIQYAHNILNKTITIAEKMTNRNTVEPNSMPNTGKASKEKSFFCSNSVSACHTSNSIIGSLAEKLLPILYELKSMIVEEKNIQKEKSNPQSFNNMIWKKNKYQSQPQLIHPKVIDIRNLFGFCKSSDWSTNINMSSIMQISPMTLQDLISLNENELELTREFIFEKISLILISYFCVSTEKRFLSQDKTQLAMKESEFWHAKTLELACKFLPVDCPLLSHIYNSYQKHYSVMQHITERLRVILGGR